jgi:hypothetical protein
LSFKSAGWNSRQNPTEKGQHVHKPSRKIPRRPQWGRSVLSWKWAVKRARCAHRNLSNTLTALAKTDINAERSAPFYADFRA